MVEAVRQQRHYKDNLCHAEIMALIQAYSQISRKLYYKMLQGRLKSTLSKRDRKGDGMLRRQRSTHVRSIDDVAECRGPKEKNAMSSYFFVFC